MQDNINIYRCCRINSLPSLTPLAAVILRQVALEMSYNPNDCIEIRWGTPEGSAEFSSCRPHAPIEQREKMGQTGTGFVLALIPEDDQREIWEFIYPKLNNYRETGGEKDGAWIK